METESGSTNRLATYECLDCGRRVRTDAHPTTCEHCGGDLRNIAGMKE